MEPLVLSVERIGQVAVSDNVHDLPAISLLKPILPANPIASLVDAEEFRRGLLFLVPATLHL